MMRSPLLTPTCLTVLLAMLSCPAYAAITYTTQQSELVTLPDGSQVSSHIWVAVEPTVSGLTLQLPAWTCYYHATRYDVPAANLTVKASAQQTSHIVLYIIPGQKGMEYLLLNNNNPEAVATKQSQVKDQGADEAIPIVWFDVAPGTEDLNTTTIYVLKHVQS